MAENKTEKGTTLNIDIVKSDTRVTLPVSGLFGGFNSQGELVAHLYVEYPDFPKTGNLTIDASKNNIVQNALNFRRDHVTREVVSTIVIQGPVVAAFAAWFQGQAKTAAEMDFS